MPTNPLHLPIAHIDVSRICHNFELLTKLSATAKASSDAPFAAAPLPTHFGQNKPQGFTWPAQLAVIKADAYGHGHIETAKALLQTGVDMFASGSVQECVALREHIKDSAVILNLLGPISTEDIKLCTKHGIIPLIHNQDQVELLKEVTSTLPIAIKCNTGMARLGFDAHELDDAIVNIKSLPYIMPVLALSHLHSADTTGVQEEIKIQGTNFAHMLKKLRAIWPNIAASLANSAGTIFAEEIKSHIGAHICRPGIALYGSNPFNNTSFASRAKGLLPAMWVSAPILGTRKLQNGHGIGYGHTFVAKQDLSIAIIACGYADGFSRGLTHKGEACIEGTIVPLVGRVAMQMIAANITKLQNQKPKQAWLLGGPYENAISTERLATTWETITYEVLCILGNNTRKYMNFD